MKILAILQARMSSSRLPGKILKDLLGKPMIIRQIERIMRSRLIDNLVVATSVDQSDDATCATLLSSGVKFYRGSLDDVLGRFSAVLKRYPADHVVRLTADCPLADPSVIDAVIAHHLANAVDATTNTIKRTFPHGLDVEVVRASALIAANELAQLPQQREHVMPYIYEHQEKFSVAHYLAHAPAPEFRWTVDYPEDFRLVQKVYRTLFPSNPLFTWHDIIELFKRDPELHFINEMHNALSSAKAGLN